MSDGEVFDALVERGEIVVHATEAERIRRDHHSADGLVVADTREQVAALNAAIRDHRRRRRLGERLASTLVTVAHHRRR